MAALAGRRGRGPRSMRSSRACAASITTKRSSSSPASRWAVFRTHPWAPRVLIANALLVPAWATWEIFRDLEDRGLTMYGQMTAGSWIYIGTQGILQGTYETLAELARRHFGGSLSGRLVVTAGLGGMGGAQPLAVTMNEGIALVIEVDPERIARRLATRYVDERASSLDEALTRIDVCRDRGEARSIALEGNAAEVLPELVRRGVVPDVLTDQTSAHDALNGYVPAGLSIADADALRRGHPAGYIEQSLASMAAHVGAMLALKTRGAITFDYGNNIRAQAHKAGVENAFDIPGFVPEYIRPLFCAARGRFGGRRSPAIRATSPRPTISRSRCLLKMRRSAAGSAWLASGWRSRGCRRAFSGSGMVSAHASAWRSTSWCVAAP